MKNKRPLSNTTYFHDLTKEELEKSSKIYCLIVADEFGFKFKKYHLKSFIIKNILKMVKLNNEDK